VAAAATIVALLSLWPRLASPPTVEVLRERLIASAVDAVRLDWQPLGEYEPQGVKGEVVWSQSRQEGYMTFEAAPTNDPTVEQLQLWIFDESQQHPVDGGVFDIDRESGRVIVPIDAKLRVDRPTRFAVTIEKPGGVVVSGQERVVLLSEPMPPSVSDSDSVPGR
jgi:hypothetical protein